MEGSPHKRARSSKAQREVTECGSVRELQNLSHNTLINFTGALLDMSDLRYVETTKAGRDCMAASFATCNSKIFTWSCNQCDVCTFWKWFCLMCQKIKYLVAH